MTLRKKHSEKTVPEIKRDMRFHWLTNPSPWLIEKPVNDDYLHDNFEAPLIETISPDEYIPVIDPDESVYVRARTPIRSGDYSMRINTKGKK